MSTSFACLQRELFLMRYTGIFLLCGGPRHGTHYEVLQLQVPGPIIGSFTDFLQVTMGSATVLLAASLIDSDVDLYQEPNKTSWEQAVAIFEYYVSYDVSAQGGLQALWDYRQKFEATKRRGESSNEAGLAEPQPYPQGDGALVAESEETPPGIDGVFDSQWPGGDLSQAFYDWNWLDFDIPEFMLS